MMLGTLLARLGEPGEVEAVLVEAGDLPLLGRLREEAAARAITPGELAAGAVRHFMDRADDEAWLSLVGRMTRSPDPALAAIHTILASALAVR